MLREHHGALNNWESTDDDGPYSRRMMIGPRMVRWRGARDACGPSAVPGWQQPHAHQPELSSGDLSVCPALREGGGKEEPALAPRCGHSHSARCRVLDGYLDEVSIVADRLPLEQQGYFAIPGRNTVCQSKRTACYRDIGGLRLTMHRSWSHQTVSCSTLGNERLNDRCWPRCPPGSLRNVSAVAGIVTWDRNEWPR